MPTTSTTTGPAERGAASGAAEEPRPAGGGDGEEASEGDGG